MKSIGRIGENNERRVPEIRMPVVNTETGREEERKLSPIPHDSIGIPETMSPQERTEAFQEAYKKIVGNEKLERLAVRGIKGEQGAFSSLMNSITELCCELSDSDIDSILRKFNEILISKADRYSVKYDLTMPQIEQLKTGKNMLGNSTGIKSTARFVRARMKLHELKPATVPAFYFENYFDARHNVDLIEVFEGSDGLIMNLIQIKSRDYTQEEIEKNTLIHTEWVNGCAMDIEVYEKTFEVEPEDSERYKEFFADLSHVEDLLLEIITNENISTEIFFDRLGLKDKPNVEKAWILSQYIEAIKDAFLHVEELGLSEEEVFRIRGIVSDIEKRIELVKEKKKDLRGISEIHSICTVAERLVSDKVIFRGGGGQMKAISMHE